MGMPDLARIWTREEVLALPDDGNRYELVDGELLVSPSPSGIHQRAILGLFRLIDPYVRANRIGAVSIAPADLDLGSGQVVQPDLFVGAMVAGREPIEWAEFGIPVLVVEILSPNTYRHDRLTKRRRYQRSLVPDYWLVHPESRLVETWTPASEEPTTLTETLRWHPNPALPPLTIDLPTYFKELWAES